MTKFYCDECGEELKPGQAHKRLTRKLGRVSVEVITAVDGVWNAGEVCPACVVKTVSEGEDTTETRKRKAAGAEHY